MNLTVRQTTDTIGLARSIVVLDSEVTKLAYDINRVIRKAVDNNCIVQVRLTLFTGKRIDVTALPN